MSFLMFKNFQIFDGVLNSLSNNKQFITTLNAHSYNIALVDEAFKEALQYSNILIPDGIGVVWATKWLTGKKLKKIAGEDLFFYEMNRLQSTSGKCFFLGSSEATLARIKEKAIKEYPAVTISTYSPPYKPEFSEHDNTAILGAINAIKPDVLFVGMTAPKQEKWAYRHFSQLQVGHVCCIGAVFDFYAGTIKRAPKWMIKLGLEWLYRLIKEPRRMWKRYIIGNVQFIWYIIKEKYHLKKQLQ